MRTINETLDTCGTGHWTRIAKEVQLTKLVLHVWDTEGEEGEEYDGQHGELRVYFSDTWKPQEYGHIYTDPLFLEEFLDYLTRADYNNSGVGYSEFGMQGKDYVSFDVGHEFIISWNSKYSS